MDTSTISIPSEWRDAVPVLAPPLPPPRLMAALARAAEAKAEGTAVEWPRIGRYQACGRLGEGGMSTVWEGHDGELDRRVAIKLLKPELPAHECARLRREAQALARLSHPNVVQVYEVIDLEGISAIVMELLDGPTLRRWQQQVPRPGWKECVQFYLQAGRGLAAAHAVGLVHRDFKPDNCMLDAGGRVRVLDFGLAAHANADETEQDAVPRLQGDSVATAALTRTGTILGTEAYMPPERREGGSGGDGAAGDQYSFCVALYEALHGERPARGRSEQKPGPERTRVPLQLERALLRGLANEPRERWPAMEDLLTELERISAPPTRGVAFATSMVGAVVVATTFVAMQGGTEPRPCEGAAGQLHGIWDDGRRRAVADAILGAGSQHARDTWARVEPALDEYAWRWMAKHTEVCEATRVTQAQTEADMGARMRCLSGRKIALREVVGVLAQPREATRASAIELVASLPTLAECDDLEALQAQLPPPVDSEQAAAVEVARARLARARVRREAGDHEGVEADASRAVEEADRLEYEPLLAEALLERGEARVRLEQHHDAQVDLERAQRMALRIEHRHVEARAASVLARLIGQDPPRLDQARQWGETALALAQRRGSDRLLLAEASSALGYVRMMKGWLTGKEPEREAAAELHRQALVIYEGSLGSWHPTLAGEFESLGDVLMKQKRPEEALEHYEWAIAIYEHSLGSSHPAVAEALAKAGEALARQREPDMAIAMYERALEITQAALGPWHPSLGLTWTRLGAALHMQGRLPEALELHRHALEIVERTEGGDPLVAIGILSEIGFVLRDQGRMVEAVMYYDEVLARRERLLGPAKSDAARVLNNIGKELLDASLLDAAEERHRQALARLEAVYGPTGCTTGVALLGLGEVALTRNERLVATAHAERTLSLCEEVGGRFAPQLVAQAEFLLARVAWGDPAQRVHARRLAERARDRYRTLGEGHEDALAEVEEWLAASVIRESSTGQR